MTDNPTAAHESDANTVANRAAQVITRMGADIRTLTGERDRYRTAWRSARERAQAYGEGILRVVKDREQYQEWLRQAEERAAAASVPPPADQTALRAVVIDALYEARRAGLGGMSEAAAVAHMADAVLAVLPEQTDRAAEAERPLSPDYEHPECGFHWHGRDDMDIPMRDGQPVCPRCELAKVEKKLAYVQRMRDEVGAECKRRGRIKLEQAERIVRLERELDGVRDQLGKEMLRADDAEAELRRVAAEEQPAETHSCRNCEGIDPDTCLMNPDRPKRPPMDPVHILGIDAAPERPAVGEQPETQEARPECAHCWREIENRGTPSMGGNHHVKWVHVPGGFTVCFPQRGGSSPLAEPRTPE